MLPFNQGLTLKSGSLLTLLAHRLPFVGTWHTTSLPDKHPIRLVPPRDIDALAVGLLDLLNSPEQRVQIGGDSLAFKEFGWQNIVKAHLEVYQNVL